jgi:hypothetical protein
VKPSYHDRKVPHRHPGRKRASRERLGVSTCLHLVRQEVCHTFPSFDKLTYHIRDGYYSPHSHRGLTTHLIRRGTFTVTYPEDNANLHNGEVKKESFGPGARIDVPAGKVHEVWIGDEGCEYVIGE